MTERRFILRGFAAGGISGLLAYAFARIMAEPVIQQSINYESGRDSMIDAIRKATGRALEPPGPDIFSRGIQRNLGIGIGLIAFGVAMGGLVAVAYILIRRRSEIRVRPRVLALWIALTGFFAVYLVPYLKYPANPPAIGHPGTIGQRGLLYVVMVVVSIICTTTAFISARRMTPRFGLWNASLLAGAGFIVVVAVVMAILPSLGHLHYNIVYFGHFSSETPQPLHFNGRIVYPGFPADALFKFRLYSIINQLILWTALGLGFGALAERLTAGASARSDARDPLLAPPVQGTAS